MKKSILTLLFALVTTFSFSQENDSYKSSVKKLIQVSGSDITYLNELNQLFTTLKQEHPDVPEVFWTEAKDELNKDAIDQFVSMVSPAYKKHLTEADIRGVIAFYQTPLGKRFAEKTPLIMQEPMPSRAYKKHLTEADMRGVIAFYQTPLGKRFAEKTPLINQEVMNSAEELSLKIAERIDDRLKAKGY